MSEPYSEQTLTIGDRINYPFLLGGQIQALIDVQKKENFSEEDINIPIEALLHLVPSNLKDPEFKEDIKNALSEEEVDVRPSFSGVPLKEEYCKEKGIPITEIQEIKDPFKTLNAIIDCLQRKQMLLRVTWQEIFDGTKFKPKTS